MTQETLTGALFEEWVGREMGEVQKGWDICISMADLC